METQRESAQRLLEKCDRLLAESQRLRADSDYLIARSRALRDDISAAARGLEGLAPIERKQKPPRQ